MRVSALRRTRVLSCRRNVSIRHYRPFMDIGVIVYCAELEAPALRETARRILKAEAARFGVSLDPVDVMLRRAPGAVPRCTPWRRPTSWCST